MERVLATYAVTESDQQFLGFLLKLANRKLTDHWQFGKLEDAQIVIVDTDQQQGQQYWETHSTQSKIMIALSWWQPKIAESLFIPKPLREWQNLVSALNSASLVAEQQNMESPPVSDSEYSESDSFIPENCFLGKLQKAITEKSTCCFNYKNNIPVYVFPEQNVCFSQRLPIRELNLDNLHVYTAEAESIQKVALTTEQLMAEVQRKNLLTYNTESLLWLSTLLSSKGRLLADINREQVVYLSHWPNFTQLFYHPEHMILTAFMTHHRSSLSEIAEKTAQPLNKVIDFVNACAVLGLIEYTQKATPAKTKTVSKSKQTLFKGILNCLAKVTHYQTRLAN